MKPLIGQCVQLKFIWIKLWKFWEPFSCWVYINNTATIKLATSDISAKIYSMSFNWKEEEEDDEEVNVEIQNEHHRR